MSEKILPSRLDGYLLSFALVLANLRATIFIFLHPDPSKLLGPAWIEIGFWFVVSLTAAYSLIQHDQVFNYLQTWRKNKLVAFFLLLAFLSVFWSIRPLVTIFRALELLFSTLIAAYFGRRFRSDQIMGFLFWFGAILLILSVTTVFMAPKTGTMYWAPFDGAWRGIYWHRNHLASIMAFLNTVFLGRMLIAFEHRNWAGSLDGFFYIASLVVLYFARSVTGYFLVIVLHFSVFFCWFWLRVSHRLRPRHYYLSLGVFVVSLILILLNLDIIFAVFHRDTTLTGRMGLWTHLLRAIILQRRWLGYGFGAAWTVDSFREQVRLLAGWPSQPLIADNGFLDILLHLGLFGLFMFVGILMLAFFRAVRYAGSRKTISDFFPVLILVYAFVANLSFSLFAETEVFVWLLIVMILFRTTPVSADNAIAMEEHFHDDEQ